MSVSESVHYDSDLLALDPISAMMYIRDHLEEAENVLLEIIAYKGHLCYADVVFRSDGKTLLVNNEWCENLTCAVAYLLTF